MERYPGGGFHYLEHGNVCAEPERKRNSLGHIVQLPVQRRSAAASCQCHGRVLQNRFPDYGCNPGPRRWHSNANADCYGNRHFNTYGYRYTDLNANCDPEADALTQVEPGPKTAANFSAAPLALLPGVRPRSEVFQKNFFCVYRET
jgi:hypothetical protein